MKQRNVKKIVTWIVVPLMAAIFILDIITVALCNHYCKRYPIKEETFTLEDGDDRIHFLNTANSDAILLESNGRFAMIDSGEGDTNPRRKTEYHGFEKTVVDYIIKAAGDETGVAHLDFILGTHCHYDHIGCFDAILTDDRIAVEKAYFKGIDSRYFNGYEKNWGLEDTYEKIVEDLKAKNIEQITSLPTEPFVFGDFTLQFCNTTVNEKLFGKGENSESVGVKVTKGDKTAFLAGDITRTSGVEDEVKDFVGDVDLLKIGHHGYYGSSSMSFMRSTKPEIAIVTNQLGKVYPNVKWNLTMVAKCPFYATYDNDGLIVTFTDSGELLLSNHIH